MTLKQKAQKLDQLIDDYNDLSVYHNGSLLHIDIDSAENGEEFLSWLGDYNREVIDLIQEKIKKDFNEDVKIFQHGRSGATFYPDNYFTSCNNGLRKEAIEDYFDNWERPGYSTKEKIELIDDNIKIVKRAIGIIDLVNEKIKKYKTEIPEIWRRYKND